MNHSPPPKALGPTVRGLGALCALALAVGACSPATGLDATDIACPPTSTDTYDTFGAAFMNNNCSACHGPGSRTDTTSLDSIRANSNAIIEVTVYNVNMPKDASLTDAERIRLGKWLNCGAP